MLFYFFYLIKNKFFFINLFYFFLNLCINSSTILKNSESFNIIEYYSSNEYIKKKKAKFDEINGDTFDSNITEEEFNYLVQKSNLKINIS